MPIVITSTSLFFNGLWDDFMGIFLSKFIVSLYFSILGHAEFFMKRKIKIFIFLMFIFPFCSYASQFPSDCQTNQATLNTCAEKKIEQLNKELNRLYKLKISSLKNQEYINLLIESESAWLEYRAKDCDYQSGRGSGSYQLFIKYGCIIDRTETRIRDLKGYMGCIDGGCPY